MQRRKLLFVLGKVAGLTGSLLDFSLSKFCRFDQKIVQKMAGNSAVIGLFLKGWWSAKIGGTTQ